MTLWEEKRIERIEKDRIRKQQDIENFLNSVDLLRNNIDSVVNPSMEIVKETDKCYLNYYVVKYPNCLLYKLSMMKKDYPFNTYYTKDFYKNEIPVKYLEVFTELEKYFTK